MKRIKFKRGTEVLVEGFEETFRLVDTMWMKTKKVQAVISMRTYETFWVSPQDITKVEGDD